MSIFSIIDHKVEEYKNTHPELLSGLKKDIREGAAFMLYSLDTILREYKFEDIEEGIVDSSYRKERHDYGVDAVYITANREIIKTIEQLDEFNEHTKFVIHVFQLKKGRGVDQACLLKYREGIKEIIIEEKYAADKNSYLYRYMTNLTEIKQKIYLKFSSDQIKVQHYIGYGGVAKTILDNDLLMKQLHGICDDLTNGGYVNANYEIFDAQRLIDWHKKGDEIIDTLKYQKTFKYITDTDGYNKLNGYVSVISAKEIARVVKEYQTSLFEANIRDFYRKKDLNSKILKTSTDEKESKYFWSFNNGLTITCNKVEELPGDKYRLYGMQIVNGCQTSNALYQALYNIERYSLLEKKKDSSGLSKKESDEMAHIKNLFLRDDANILVKIIETDDPELIYKITETTNSQTPIKKFSLKANDDIQLLIEEYLKHENIFYERRVNYWKNQGKRNIVGIQKLFQLYMSQIELKPSQVKTRPSDMFEDNYEEVFSDPAIIQKDFNLYLIPIIIDQAILKKIRQIQRNNSVSDEYDKFILSYGKLHLGCLVLYSILGAGYNKSVIIKKALLIKKVLQDSSKFDKLFYIALENLKKLLQSVGGKRKEAIPSCVKKQLLDEKISKFIRKKRT
ncbi:AIPR family protein [bacterium]|nr:AIPR family protein [bacterium]